MVKMQMNRYWMSWYQPEGSIEPRGNDPLLIRWWISGQMSDVGTGKDYAIICALIEAFDQAEAIDVVNWAWPDRPKTPPIADFNTLGFRFIIEHPPGWIPSGERFPMADSPRRTHDFDISPFTGYL